MDFQRTQDMEDTATRPQPPHHTKTPAEAKKPITGRLRAHKVHQPLRPYMLIVLALVLVGGGFAWWLAIHRATAPDNSLPVRILKKIDGFQPYYLKPGFSTDFVVNYDTVSYADGVLVFSMKNSVGKTLAFTEQALPPHFEPSMVHSNKQFNTEYGLAMVTDGQARTTGTLFTKDNTWVVINAPDPVGATIMQQILGALAPYNPSSH